MSNDEVKAAFNAGGIAELARQCDAHMMSAHGLIYQARSEDADTRQQTLQRASSILHSAIALSIDIRALRQIAATKKVAP